MRRIGELEIRGEKLGGKGRKVDMILRDLRKV